MDVRTIISTFTERGAEDFILVEEEGLQSQISYEKCKLCKTYVSAPYYTNNKETGTINLHKVCANLPMEFEHSGHILRARLTSFTLCNICGAFGVPYICSVRKKFAVCIRCALKLFPFTHQCHLKHPMIPIHDCDVDFHCSACRGNGCGISYQCTTCLFQVHQECVSTRTVELPFHPHGLKLICPLPKSRYIYCQICRQDMKGEISAYHCASCSYFIHLYHLREIEQEIHHHELFLIDEQGASAPGNCSGCGLETSIPYLFCQSRSCKSFFLHKLCADLPENVEHHLHPEHALTLSHITKYSSFINKPEEVESFCDVCHVPWSGFYYFCDHDSCNFTIDIVCALKTLHLKHEFHQHPLISSPMKGPLACHACNIDREGTSYQCSTCRFWVHQQCASVPAFKKHDLHPHKLKLTFSFADVLPKNHEHLFCDVCRKGIKLHNWAYHCSGCRYFTHIHNCSDLNRENGSFDYEAALAVAVHLPFKKESVTLATLFFMESNQEEETEVEPEPMSANGTKTGQILFLDPNKSCDLCAELLASPCRNCVPCKYYLSRSIMELHDRSIMSGLYSILRGKEESCKGFAMYYSENILTMKISSSVLPRYVKHEGHDHVLCTSYIAKQTRTWCSACKKIFQGYGFTCNICNFTIDTYCALLPRSVSHSNDKEHGFKLTYYSIEDVEEYVCEICEGDITTMWFYHCEECDLSIHPKCIWKIHIKFGPFFKPNSEKDEIILVPTATSLPYDCIACEEKETSGCYYSLLVDGAETIHLKCYPKTGINELKKNNSPIWFLFLQFVEWANTEIPGLGLLLTRERMLEEWSNTDIPG